MKYLGLILLILPLPSLGNENPFSCVAPLVMEGLFGLHGGHSTFSTGYPNELPQLPVPKHFSLIGSTYKDLYANVAYFVEEPPKNVRSEVRQAFIDENWMAIGDALQRQGQGGFVSVAQTDRSTPTYWCKDPYGMFTVRVRNRDAGGSLVNVERTSMEVESCESQKSRSRLFAMQQVALPRLELPDDVTRSGRGGYSSGRGTATTSHEFKTTTPLAQISSSFSRQMLAQNWIKEGEWSGTSSAGSAWISEDDQEVVYLRLLQKNNQSIQAEMTLNKR